MKIIVGGTPVNVLIVQLIDDFDQLIEETKVWATDLIPTINDIVDSYQIDRILLIGSPISFIEHLKDTVEHEFPNILVLLGE